MPSFLTQMIAPGQSGLDLHSELDLIDPSRLSRMTNLNRPDIGSLTGRAGQTILTNFNAAPGLGDNHTLGRFDVPLTGAVQRLWGVGTGLYYGAGSISPGLMQVDSGYSGNPMLFIPYRPTLSGDSWMVVADSTKLSKVRASDGLVTPLGMAPPSNNPDQNFHIDEFRIVANPTSFQLGAIDNIEFTSVGFTITNIGPGVNGLLTQLSTLNTIQVPVNAAGSWVVNNGTGGAGTVATDTTIFKLPGGSIKFTTAKGGASGAYYNFFNLPATLNLSTYPGSVAVTDQDIVHIWLRCDQPSHVAEIRLAFVISGPFSNSTAPGTDTGGTANSDAYQYSFRPSDFQAIAALTSTPLTAATTANTNQQTQQQLTPSTDSRASTQTIRQQTDASRTRQAQLLQGNAIWTEFGVIGYPLHLADFRRIGNTAADSLAAVTGLVVTVVTTDNTNAINVWMDDLHIQGGAGLDSSLPGLQPYNYRWTNYDPRTGAESNPSPPQNVGFALDSLRQAIVVNPPATGNTALRQRIYRAGGSLTNNWYFVATNSADGATYTDSLADITLAATAITVALDNDQPVASLTAGGTTIANSPINCIFGPIQGLFFGLGDPNRPGTIYWTKSGNVDAWPAGNTQDVCSPAEQLVSGTIYAGQAYAASRARVYLLTPNILANNQISVLPTPNNHGCVNARCFISGPFGMFQVDRDGIYQSQGADAQSLTENWLRDLFYGRARNGYNPIDWTKQQFIQLALADNELWFLYKDTGGQSVCFIYSLIFQFWRPYIFGKAVSGLGPERAGTGTSVQMVLGGGPGLAQAYLHTGTTDAGLPISYSFRTGALDQGAPRENKFYGDLTVDVDRQGATLTVTPYFTNETIVGTAQTISTGSGRTRYYLDVEAAGQPVNYVQGLNISLDVAWTSSTAPPVFYRIGPSYIQQADITQNRPSDWDPQGRLSDKLVKGILFEFNSFGLSKSITLQADGANQQTITLNSNGRLVQEFAFPQFIGRELRWVPNDAIPIQIYSWRWIFDEEPVSLTRWETQELDLSYPGWKYIIYGHISLNSTATVSLVVNAYDQAGNITANTYTIPSTSGVKIANWVPFAATKGYLFKFIFTSANPFRLYREESALKVQDWDQQQPRVVKPFGTDDLDLVRTVHDAGLVALRDAYGFSTSVGSPGPQQEGSGRSK